MHNLSIVMRFEIVRTLKKKSFWILAFAFPVLIVGIAGVMIASNQATNDAVEKMKDAKFTVAVTDRSGLISPALLTGLKAETMSEKQQGIDKVKNGQLDAYIYYPQNVSKDAIEIYGKDVGIFDNARYDAVAKQLLSMSVQDKVSPDVRAIVTDKVSTKGTTYRDGQAYDGIKQMILPGLFLVLFYFLISFFGSQMLTSTTEEKENRVIEMLLTTVEARTLIVGKIVALVLLAVIQGLLLIVPALIGYFGFHDKLNLPFLDLSSLPVDPMRIGIGAAIFALSFLLFTGMLVAAGAAAPTAKEAGSFFGIFMMLMFGPLYAASLFFSAPQSAIVQFLSYFPLTAPIPLLLRNAAGNLAPHEAAIAIVILSISTVIVLAAAVRLFRFGALEYTRKLSWREIIGLK